MCINAYIFNIFSINNFELLILIKTKYLKYYINLIASDTINVLKNISILFKI